MTNYKLEPNQILECVCCSSVIPNEPSLMVLVHAPDLNVMPLLGYCEVCVAVIKSRDKIKVKKILKKTEETVNEIILNLKNLKQKAEESAEVN